MTDFDSMSVGTLQKLIDEERPKLKSPDAGTGKTHLNREEILTEKVMIAQQVNRMAFFLKMRDAIAADDFDEITDECRPYLVHAATPVMESTRA